MTDFKLLSTHGEALVCIARDPGMRLRDIADAIGVTERTAHTIVSDLVDGGYVERTREGVRNRYEIKAHEKIRDPMLSERRLKLGDLLASLSSP
jgi:DNA-binding MarR family transcriptional regulator